MVVGKPNFDLNSFGIQYKEKKVNYTTKRIGMNSKVTTDVEDAKEHAQWSRMNTSQSNSSKKRGEKPNAAQSIGNAPRESPTVSVKPKGGRQVPKDTVQPATSSPPSPAPKESTSVLDDVPNTQEELVTREGGSTHIDVKPRVPKTRISGRANQEASVKLSEDKANPVLPKNAANDIILDMNILKLDLMKGKPSKEHLSHNTPSKQHTTTIEGWEEDMDSTDNGLGSVDSFKKSPKDLGKTADETIFKAISLKLDLSKMDYNTAGQYPHVKGTSGYKDPKKKLPTAPKDDPRRMSPSFDESHNISEDENT